MKLSGKEILAERGGFEEPGHIGNM